MNKKGHLRIPQEFRQELRLEAGAPVAVLRFGSALILLPQERHLSQLCKRISARLLRREK
jgi:virulence-associated protein VagC